MLQVELSDAEWQQLLNILGTTKEHAWVVTNPLLMKIGGQLQMKQAAGPPPGSKLDSNGKEVRNE